MFGKNNTQNDILPFFFPDNNEANNVLTFTSSSIKDGYQIFIVGSLFSTKVENLSDYLDAGVDAVATNFDNVDLPILDRMKASIFQGGDFLANKMMSAGEIVEDVDFSVAFIAFKDDVVYVWLDGNLNVRIYRAEQSLLINDSDQPQFNGSTNVQTGDIFAVSYGKNLYNHDENYENYVLENTRSPYPALYIDYQIDNNEDSEVVESGVPVATNQHQNEEENHIHVGENSPLSYEKMPAEPYARPIVDEPEDFENGFERMRAEDAAKAKSGGSPLNKIKEILNPVSSVYFAVTSKVVDFVYQIILRKNSHQVERFKSSPNRKMFQHGVGALVLVLIISLVYVGLFRGGSTSTTPNQATNKNTPTATGSTKSEAQMRTEIQAKSDEVAGYFSAAQVDNFNQAFTTLQSLVSNARANGFTDKTYLDTVIAQAQTQEDSLNKVTPITKVDEVYFADNIANANIVDFSVVGTDVYAIDKANSQILKSAGGQQFEVFAGDPKFNNMLNIQCETDKCYIADEGRGLVLLNLANKSFTILSGSGVADAGKGVKEMVSFASGSSYRLYTLIPGNSEVIRYDRVGENFSSPGKWNTDAGFGPEVQDFAIDGNVYELASSGVLRKFYNRKLDPSFKGLGVSNPKLGTKLHMAMTPARNAGPNVKNRMYIADAENKLVAVFEKDLDANKQFKFLGSYKYRGSDKITFNDFEEIFLTKDEQSLYILEGNAVYKIRVGTI